MPIAPLDIVFLVIVGISSIRTAMRGFVAEIMSFAAVVGGVAAAVLLSGRVAAYIGAHYGVSVWNKVIAFLGIFILCYLFIKLFERAIYRIVDGINLEKLDRALGFFLGIAEGLLVMVVIVLILQVQPFFKLDSTLHASRAASIIMQLFPLQTSPSVPAPPAGGTSV
ncbi:MAG TPA: CvpA family protein [Spirochaetia bacterium]|nr:CvpA family protein [Spirochaetia bacterium]